MKKWSVVYTMIPTNYHDDKHAVVEANTPDDAYRLIEHALGDDIKGKLRNYDIKQPTEYVEPNIDGKILSL